MYMSLLRVDVLLATLLILGLAIVLWTTRPAAAANATKGLIEGISSGKLKVVDLTHPLSSKTPTWDGSEEYHYKTLTTIDKDGYFSGELHVPEHFGTHMDAPAHFCKGTATIDQIPAARLVLLVVLINVCDEAQKNPDYALTVEKVKQFEKQTKIPAKSMVLLYTGWGKRFSNRDQYRNADQNKVMHFPGYSADAAKYLADECHVASLGIDTMSIDPGNSENFDAHKAGLSRGLYFLENLDNLDKLPAYGALIFCGPLPIEGGSGSPSRVLAITP
jgi:kynurenine formamidase